MLRASGERREILLSQAHSFFEDLQGDERPKRNAAAQLVAVAAPEKSGLQRNTAGLLPEIRNLLNSAKLCTAFLERHLSKIDACGGSEGELMDAVKTIASVIDRVSELATELAHASPSCSASIDDLSEVRSPAAELVMRGMSDVAPANGEACAELSDLEQSLSELVRVATRTALSGGQVLLRARRQSVVAPVPSGPSSSRPAAI
jgi:hypothetical protein